ncbi:MAG: hypothetical protein II007_08875 [Gammaproteobacteria bacterium]|nr:hypothetical protein [Gammaproteobacteria bacterium]
MSNLVDFLSKLGSDPVLADAYTRDPEATMTDAGLSEEDKNLLRNSDVKGIENKTGVAVKMLAKLITTYKE